MNLGPSLGQAGIYVEKNINWSNNMSIFTQDLLNVVNSGLNTVYLGFYMDLYGCRAGCKAWEYMSDEQKDQVLDSGMNVILSAGGEGESIQEGY